MSIKNLENQLLNNQEKIIFGVSSNDLTIRLFLSFVSRKIGKCGEVGRVDAIESLMMIR